MKTTFVSVCLLLFLAACNTAPTPEAATSEAESNSAAALKLAPDADLDRYLAQYAPYEMNFDASALPQKDRDLLKKLVEAAQQIDILFEKQTSLAAIQYRDQLKQSKDPAAAKALTLLRRNSQPYEFLNDNAPFIGDEPYYGGGELYPRGLQADTLKQWLEGKSEMVRSQFMDPYTVIREDGNGGYQAFYYHEVWPEETEAVAKLLEEAAAMTDNAQFKNYLTLKAEGFRTDDWYRVDAAWVDMDAEDYDIIIGPFETYSDGILGVKAKYEAYVEVVDKEESAKLEVYKKYLSQLENNLPAKDVYKSEVKGLTAKFRIVRDIYRGGEAASGYQAVATNLPNDPRIHAEKGTVKTFWTNMFKARFETIIVPVSERLIDPAQQQYLSNRGFFQFVLMHEICHAIGPRTVKVGPKKGTAANAAIGPLYNAVEEGKADITGLWSLMWLMDQGVVDKELEREFYVSYLGSLFRSIRFGMGQAHGKAAAYSINYLHDRGALIYDEEAGLWSVDFEKFPDGVRDLAAELVVLLGDGETAKVQAFFDRWTQISPQMEASLKKVEDLPIDVLLEYHNTWE